MKRVFSFTHSRVARRIFSLFVVCALLPVCVLALLSLHRVSTRLEQDSHERLRQVGKNAGMTILEGMTLLQAELESMPIPPGDGIKKISWQTPQTEKEKRFRAVTVVNRDAVWGALEGVGNHLSTAANAHLDDGNALILANAEASEPVYMATSANRNLPRHGLLLGEINPGYLWTLVGYTLPPGIDICILAPSGKELHSTLPLTPELASLVISSQKRSSTGQFEWQSQDDDYLVNYWSILMKPAYLADSWTVVAVQSRRDSLGPARSFFTTFLLVVILTMFIVVFASSVLIRRSLVPLSILKDGARRLSRGDFHSKVEITSGDEFEDLATSFNDMSVQLGKQFTSLNEMGSLVQTILAAHDRVTITDAVMSRFRNSVSCEWLGISLMEGSSPLQMRTSYNYYTDGTMADEKQFDTLLNGDEIKALRVAEESLHVSSEDGFTALLAPMTGEGAREFFLLPIFVKDRFLGILTLGYRRAPQRIREELVRSRQVADEIAVALDNVRLINELSWLNRGTIEVIANAVDAKSPWTAGHSRRVTRLALEIGKEMGLSREDLELLQLGGLFHDIGKIGVPEYILDKPERLTEEEYTLIKKHPEKGAEMLGPIRAYHEAIPIVAQHHEQYDGQGYPLGLTGTEIVLGARIMAVADVFDALNSDRPYRQGWDIGMVASYLKERAGSAFDPAVVKAFLKIDYVAYLEPSAGHTLIDAGIDSWQEGQ